MLSHPTCLREQNPLRIGLKARLSPLETERAEPLGIHSHCAHCSLGGQQCNDLSSVSNPALVCLFSPFPAQNSPGHREISSQSTALVRHSKLNGVGTKCRERGNSCCSWAIWEHQDSEPSGVGASGKSREVLGRNTCRASEMELKSKICTAGKYLKSRNLNFQT